jgi:dinuclear metal center YbgI/SA1388 family protein
VSQVRIPLAELVAYLDEYLRVREVPDDANALNGLQVENSGSVSRLVAAVDASLQTIAGLAADVPGSLLLVHHGMFWDGNQPVAGRRYRRLKSLFQGDTALYSAHIPLDIHPDVGNNAVLARQLGLTVTEWFGLHKGISIGVAGPAPPDLRQRDAMLPILARTLGIPPDSIRLIPAGPEQIRRIGIITGGAGSAIGQAHAAGCDTYITGEGAAHTYFDATELGMNVVYAGHYATETVGVQALARHLSDRFNLPWEFHDHPTGM